MQPAYSQTLDASTHETAHNELTQDDLLELVDRLQYELALLRIESQASDSLSTIHQKRLEEWYVSQIEAERDSKKRGYWTMLGVYTLSVISLWIGANIE